MDYIVKDSTVWSSSESTAQPYGGGVLIGIVVEEQESKKLDSIVYKVEVNNCGRRYYIQCINASRLGDIYNYEIFNRLPGTTKAGPFPDVSSRYGIRPGETVVVVDFGNTEGVILGGIKHPLSGKKTKKGDVGYEFSFNGMKKEIKDDGSYKVTFNGAINPLARAQYQLPLLPKSIPDSVAYNPITAGSYYTFEKDGSYEVSDGSKILPQGIKIDKTSGTIKITSGLVTISIDKKTQKVDTSCIDYAVTAKKSFKVSSAQAEISGLTSVKIKGAKIAIGFGGVELIDSIIQLIDGIGLLIIPHHLGPCSPVASSPTWVPQIELIKAKLQLIKGSL